MWFWTKQWSLACSQLTKPCGFLQPALGSPSPSWNMSPNSGGYFPNTVSPLLKNLHIANFQRHKCACQPLYASCWLHCTTILFQAQYCKSNVFFIFCVFLSTYHLCGKYYKPITVQYYIADCVGWVPRLCWTCEQTGLTNMLLKQNLFICRGLTVLEMWFVWIETCSKC